jgi:predicted transcriptional regulator YdeE
MNQVTINSFAVSGPRDRTNNLLEATAIGKIPPLWGSFYASQPRPTEKVYGVYFDYESDASGEFTVAVGAKAQGEDSIAVRIASGTYLAFSAQGAMPSAVIEAWQRIWAHFSHEHPYVRAYTTDFEEYSSAEDVTVYVAIEKTR